MTAEFFTNFCFFSSSFDFFNHKPFFGSLLLFAAAAAFAGKNAVVEYRVSFSNKFLNLSKTLLDAGVTRVVEKTTLPTGVAGSNLGDEMLLAYNKRISSVLLSNFNLRGQHHAKAS